MADKFPSLLDQQFPAVWKGRPFPEYLSFTKLSRLSDTITTVHDKMMGHMGIVLPYTARRERDC